MMGKSRQSKPKPEPAQARNDDPSDSGPGPAVEGRDFVRLPNGQTRWLPGNRSGRKFSTGNRAQKGPGIHLGQMFLRHLQTPISKSTPQFKALARKLGISRDATVMDLVVARHIGHVLQGNSTFMSHMYDRIAGKMVEKLEATVQQHVLDRISDEDLQRIVLTRHRPDAETEGAEPEKEA
jgi:hypothetical protein